ncbi:MAG: GtrA family protein [Planctomycetota bacterium]
MPTQPEPTDRSRFLLFCLVGASGMIVDFGSFHLARALGMTGEWALGVLAPSHANMLSVALAIQWNFAGNRWLTFADRGTPALQAWWRFNVFSSSTWVLNQLIVGGLRAAYGAGPWALFGITFSSENVWKLIAIGICTFANFWLSAKLAFRENTPAAPGS